MNPRILLALLGLLMIASSWRIGDLQKQRDEAREQLRACNARLDQWEMP